MRRITSFPRSYVIPYTYRPLPFINHSVGERLEKHNQMDFFESVDYLTVTDIKFESSWMVRVTHSKPLLPITNPSRSISSYVPFIRTCNHLNAWRLIWVLQKNLNCARWAKRQSHQTEYISLQIDEKENNSSQLHPCSESLNSLPAIKCTKIHFERM